MITTIKELRTQIEQTLTDIPDMSEMIRKALNLEEDAEILAFNRGYKAALTSILSVTRE